MKISNVDEYANDLLNKGKRFYEKAKQESNDIAISAYFQSSIIFSIMSLETTIFSISDELCKRQDLTLLEKSLLLEKDVSFDNGVFSLTDKLKMSKLIDKIDFLLLRFNSKVDKANSLWWNHLKEGIRLRNELIHPKNVTEITLKQVENTILSVLKCTDVIYRAVYKKGYPHYNRKLTSVYDF